LYGLVDRNYQPADKRWYFGYVVGAHRYFVSYSLETCHTIGQSLDRWLSSFFGSIGGTIVWGTPNAREHQRC
jgi:hypothetical protein